MPAPRALAATVPPGFQETLVVDGLTAPATLAFAPDGRLFVGEQTSGRIKVVANGAATTFLDVNTVVPPGTQFDSYFERGLLGIAFDPDFATNGFVYVYHTLCKQPPASGTCPAGQSKNRVIRVYAAGDVADGATPAVIVDDIDSDAGNHNAGWIGFGPVDGKLYVATGDGGQDHTKSQNLASLSGKILRLEPDGTVPADNPYAGSQTFRGEVWAAGLRNPWRCRFRGDGRMLCADVGQDTWEELDVIFTANDYGWPTTEGPFTLAQYPTLTPPIYAYDHDGTGAAIMGGDFGDATNFPGDYGASYFFGDYVRGTIRRIVLDPTGTAAVSDALDFVSGLGGNSVTDIVAGPDGALYYTNIGAGSVRKVSYVATNHAPIAIADAPTKSGDPPLTVEFSSAGTLDEDGDPLTYSWNFGDGSALATTPNPTHQYAAAGQYRATLTVRDGKPAPGPSVATVDIVVGHRPVPLIAEPSDGAEFDAGDLLTLAGSATDVEDGPLAASSLTWKVVFHHADHTHPFLDALVGSPQAFTTANSGETDPDVWYEIVLSATDSDHMTGTTAIAVVPRTVDLTFETTPPGFGVTLDGEPHLTPFVVTSVVGMLRQIGAPAAAGYTFASWSDGGGETHVITAPPTPQTLTAAFAAPPTATPIESPTPDASATPAATTAPTPGDTASATSAVATPSADVSATAIATFTTGAPTPAVATPTAGASPGPLLGLADPAAARAAAACQRAIGRAAAAVVRTTLTGLGRCTNAIQRCIQSRRDDPTCITSARTVCTKGLGAASAATAKLLTTVTPRCPRTADLVAARGLDYAAFATQCNAVGNGADDVARLAVCIARRERCVSERLFQLEAPRAGELLAIAGVELPPGSCLTNRGGDGAYVAAADAKALTTCAATIGSAAAAFAASRVDAVAGCAQTVFECAQRKPDPAALAACMTRAGVACGRSADAAAGAAQSRARIDARCDEASLSYATLRAPAGANLDAVAGDCVEQGVDDIETLARFERCLAHQHECLAADLVRVAFPRAPALLVAVGRTLAPADCPAESAPAP